MNDFSGPQVKQGATRLLWGLTPEYPVTAVVGLGSKDASYCPVDQFDRRLENVRLAAGGGVRQLKSADAQSIFVDPMLAPKAAAEGAYLANFKYQEFRNEKKQKKPAAIEPLGYDSWPENCREQWREGVVYGECQNWARTLMEKPGNKLTPTLMAEEANHVLAPLGIQVIVRDQQWAKNQKMECFLSVAQGSAQPPIFLEVHYHGGSKDSNPIVLVGKGVTFDSGGISIKPSNRMAEMRGDMGGCAVVLSSIRAAATLKLAVNVVGLIPLTENMPSSTATKPGDIFRARNGKTVEVDNTDAEGRLILADALCYANDFKPCTTIDMATLTGAMSVALGDTASGLYTNDDALSDALVCASRLTADRLWRMPLYKRFAKTMTDYPHVDVHNVGKLQGGGSSKAAAFLQEFKPEMGEWAHLDIASVMKGNGAHDYLDDGMTGRPTRTIIEYLKNKQS